MQIEWLRAFVLLKEYGSFTEAAEEMFVSQSSFSKYIKALESHAGAPLIDRSYRSLHFTEKGGAVLLSAQKILSEYDRMMEQLRNDGSALRSVFRISVDTAVNPLPFLRFILDFFEEHPELELKLQEFDLTTAINAFDAGELDMVLGHINVIRPKSPCKEMVLQEDEIFYVGRKQDLSVIHQSIALSQVKNDRLILHQNMHLEITELLKQKKVSVNKAHSIVTTTSRDVMKAYLTGGQARSLLTRSDVTAMDPEEQLLCLPLEDHLTLRLGLLYGKNTGTGERMLVRYLKERIAKAKP
ncbi:MAG: LysR family transcriptional regulator [Blautia sp.]|nr:LysR family transcriptional regulator [Blautia sp.]